MGHEEEPLTRGKMICRSICIMFAAICVFGLAIGGMVWLSKNTTSAEDWWHDMLVTRKPDIELVSMDFTALNITPTRLVSAKWDLSIRIPNYLPDLYICLQGDLQASLLYKNMTLATSAPQKYNNLRYGSPQLLKISALVSDEDIDHLIGKDIMEDMKEKKEVQFGSHLFLTDCRQNATAIMSYACDEATLRFQPGSLIKATLFGNHPTCINF